jgi:multiple sugar transport system substrate-binding protein
MMLTRFGASTGAVLLSVALIAGCTANTESSDSVEGATPPPQAELSDVTLYVFGYDAGVEQWAADTSAAFDELDLGYGLEITVVPANDLQQTLTTRLQGGKPPDISSAPTAWVPSFAANLRDLQGIVSDEISGGFPDSVASQASFGGKLLAAPYGTSTRALYYNADFLTAAGYDSPPATWDELIEMAGAAKEANGLNAGFSVQGMGNETFAAWFPYVYWSFGGDFGTGESIEIEPAACEAGLEVLNDIANGAKVAQPDLTASDIVTIQDSVASGQSAMTISGPWFLGGVADMPVEVAPVPAGSTQSTLAVADAWISFSEGAATDEQVGAVIDFLLSVEQIIPFLQGRGFMPSLERDFSDPAFNTGPITTFITALETAKFVPLSEQWAQLQVTGESEMQLMYLGEKEPEAVCQTLINSLG